MSALSDPIESHRPRARSEPEPDPTTAELLDLFGDEYTRRVFEAVAERPRCARDVAEAADVSRPTAYRRLNDLREAGVVAAELDVCDDGHHRERFEAVAAELSVSLEAGDIEAMVTVAD